MSMNEDGERELVLGNKQLLAIFFVGVLLCGVFFAVGYVVGGNSAKAGAAATASTTDGEPGQTADGKREEPRPQSGSDTAASAPAPSVDTGGALPTAEPRVADNPAAAGAQPVAPTTAPTVTAPQPYVQPAPAATPASNPAAKSATAAPAASTASKPATATGVFVSVPEVGSSYWQVTAIGRPTADDLVRTLREGKLPAILSESSKSDLFRVLVGPYRSQLTLSDAKKKLTELGYNGLIVQKY